MSDRSNWPDYERRIYEWNVALGNLWKALSEHPLFRRIGPLRSAMQRKALRAHAEAAIHEQEAIEWIELRKAVANGTPGTEKLSGWEKETIKRRTESE
jgi:hypothetical protein